MIKTTTRRRIKPVVRAQFDAATRAALEAAGNVLANEVKRALRGGYRSSLGNQGDFVTGTSLNHVRVAPPVLTGDRSGRLRYRGEAYIRVGTDLLYNLFWEVGHFNLFTMSYERDEKWGPATKRATPRAFQAFRRVFQKIAFAQGEGTKTR